MKRQPLDSNGPTAGVTTRFALTGRIPQAEFDELVVDVDIVDVVFEYGGFAGEACV